MDGQHIAFACKVLAKDDVEERKLDTKSMMSIFAKHPTLVVVYNDPSLYLEASKMHNNFFKPDWKKHVRVWQTLSKLKDIWGTYDCPCAHVEANKEKSAKVLVCFANILDIDLLVGKVVKIRKLIEKLVDWTVHVFKQDDDAFNMILDIGKGIDKGLLYLDVKKERV